MTRWLSRIVLLVTLHLSAWGTSSDPTAADQLLFTVPHRILLKVMESVLTNDCLRDEFYFSLKYSREAIEEQCRTGAVAFVNLLDPAEENPLVMFSTKLFSMMSSSVEQQFIRDFRRELKFHKKTNDRFDVWALVKLLSPNEEIALTRMAVLFQNTSQFKGHLKEGLYKAESQKQMVSLINDLLQDLQELSFQASMEIGRVPMNFQKSYHLFVPAYLTQKLVAQGISLEFATYLAFDFNWNYEILDDRSLQWTEIKFRERPMDADTIEDVLAAFIGSSLVAKKELNPFSLQDLRERFRKNPFMARHDLLMRLKEFF